MASQLSPDDADTYYQLGVVTHSMKEYSRALPYFEKAVRLGCAHAQCLNYLAMALGQLGSARRSIYLHFKACKLNDNLVEAKLNAGMCTKPNVSVLVCTILSCVSWCNLSIFYSISRTYRSNVQGIG